MKSIAVLGATGSIGVNTLKIAKRFGIEVEALVAYSNTMLLNKQIAEFKPKYVCIGDASKAKDLDFTNPFIGQEGILELLQKIQSDTVVNALVGYSGVMPSIHAQKLGKKLALANKESLVVAGKFLDKANIYPIDSEHFGLWYLQTQKPVQKLYITASGGALRDWDSAEIAQATVADVLQHPNWSMGQKITVDSATMVNKLFELLEAKWLFKTENVDALIEKKSMVHALVEFIDGSTTAHIADVDMQLPIAYALMQRVQQQILKPIDLVAMGTLQFEKIDTKRYPLWELKQKLLQNPDLGLVLNAANDLAVSQFLQNKISYAQISQTIFSAIEHFCEIRLDCIEDIEKQNSAVRQYLMA